MSLLSAFFWAVVAVFGIIYLGFILKFKGNLIDGDGGDFGGDG